MTRDLQMRETSQGTESSKCQTFLVYRGTLSYIPKYLGSLLSSPQPHVPKKAPSPAAVQCKGLSCMRCQETLAAILQRILLCPDVYSELQRGKRLVPRSLPSSSPTQTSDHFDRVKHPGAGAGREDPVGRFRAGESDAYLASEPTFRMRPRGA